MEESSGDSLIGTPKAGQGSHDSVDKTSQAETANLLDRLDQFLEICRSIGDTPSSLLEDPFFEDDAAGVEEADLASGVGDLDDLKKSLRLLSFFSAVTDEKNGIGNSAADPASIDGGFVRVASDSPVFVGGRFLLRKMIGRGSYGVVYRAFDMVARREVALKVPRPELRGIRSVMHRFYREGTSIGKIVHPGLVPLLDMGQERSVPYLVTRLVHGPNLEQWLTQASRPMSFQLAAIWGQQLAEAVDHLHKRSIVHGDLKPSNILLEHPYEEEPLELPPELLAIRVTDFGNASMIREHESEPGERVLGTLSFMAPEQLAPKFRTDARSDVYAICAVIYEMIAGKPVFEATESRSLETAILHSLPAPLRAIRPDTPYALQAIVMKGLSKEPGERYRNAGELARELKAWLNLRAPEVLRNHKHRQFGLWLWRNRFVLSVVASSLLIISSLLLTRAYEAKIYERLALQRERNAWWSSYVDRMGVASGYLEVNLPKEVRNILDNLRRWPARLKRDDDPREFAWHYTEHMTRDRSMLVQGLPEKTQYMCMAVDPFGGRVFAGGTDGHLRVIDTESERVIADHAIEAEEITAMAVAPDGLTLAVGDSKGELRVLDVESFMVLEAFQSHTGEITGLVYTPDSNRILSTSMDGYCVKYDLRDRLTSTFSVNAIFRDKVLYSLHGLAMLPGGKSVVVAQSNDCLRVHDVASGEVNRTLTGHFGEVHQVGISGNKKWLVTTGSDRTIAFWDRGTQSLKNQIDVGSKFSYVKAPVGERSKARKVRAFATMTDEEGLDMVAVDVEEGHIKIYAIPSGDEIAQLIGDYGHVIALCWSPADRKLYASTSNGMIRVWKAPFLEHSIHSDSFELGTGPDGKETAFFIDEGVDGEFRWEGGQAIRCVQYDMSCFRIVRSASAANGQFWGATAKRTSEDGKEVFVEFRFAHAPGPDFPMGAEIGWKILDTHKITKKRFAPILKGHPTRPYFLVLDSDGRVTHFDLTDPAMPRVRTIQRDIDFATFFPDSDDVLMIHTDARKVSKWNFRTDAWTPLPIVAEIPQGAFVIASFPAMRDVLLLARVGGILEFRNIRSGKLLKTIYLPEIKDRRVRQVVFSKNLDRIFVAMGFQDLFHIDVRTGKILHHWSLLNREILKIELSADEKSLWVLESPPDVAIDDKIHLMFRRIRRIHAPGFETHLASQPELNAADPVDADQFFQ